ncbi:hypothetical protein VOLCADRAFT_92874 [Volvox carteri f. nagariensis]|uniref:Uncharacterized protein n=1 Tax=Volvox carteri f. nagariensis TaxID=3068 RepID=D8U0P4_VOLCA|nr:uncharacterized protein VOLCADRAFT_92874 [Volvox carteri f. nagariensis]EFJ46671.1 hypothetical protein VOLCADRAFT_92874 [Volvox carteri f. nagariensis]|eukprot:XP_002952200.1 hypothetical protein VOLCADRAFT_92874 [Volvox carteri f. nagariensis]
MQGAHAAATGIVGPMSQQLMGLQHHAGPILGSLEGQKHMTPLPPCATVRGAGLSPLTVGSLSQQFSNLTQPVLSQPRAAGEVDPRGPLGAGVTPRPRKRGIRSGEPDPSYTPSAVPVASSDMGEPAKRQRSKNWEEPELKLLGYLMSGIWNTCNATHVAFKPTGKKVRAMIEEQARSHGLGHRSVQNLQKKATYRRRQPRCWTAPGRLKCVGHETPAFLGMQVAKYTHKKTGFNSRTIWQHEKREMIIRQLKLPPWFTETVLHNNVKDACVIRIFFSHCLSVHTWYMYRSYVSVDLGNAYQGHVYILKLCGCAVTMPASSAVSSSAFATSRAKSRFPDVSARLFNCASWTVKSAIQQLRNKGQTGTRKPRKFDEIAAQTVVELVQADDQALLSDLATAMTNLLGTHWSGPDISRALSELGYVRTKVFTRAFEARESAQLAYPVRGSGQGSLFMLKSIITTWNHHAPMFASNAYMFPGGPALFPASRIPIPDLFLVKLHLETQELELLLAELELLLAELVLHLAQLSRAPGAFNGKSRCFAQTQDLAAREPRTQPLDLLFAKTKSGTIEALQVLDDGDGYIFTALWKGQVLKFTAAPRDAVDQSWTTERIGSHPLDDSELVRAFPCLRGKLLEDLHSHAGNPPTAFASISYVYSLSQLQDEVTRDAALWCEGTRPGAPPKTDLQSLTLTAGELVSLMQGKRGVVIVQLWNGFDRSRGQPLYDPWVVDLIEAALRTPGVRALPSVAPGGVGLTAVLFADKEPWSAWGPHLASFGCQPTAQPQFVRGTLTPPYIAGVCSTRPWFVLTEPPSSPLGAVPRIFPSHPRTAAQSSGAANTVAGSAYYKVLIGKILGYSDENIYGYVRSVGGGLTPAVIAQVDADLKKLSKAKPKLPWSRESSRGKKAPAGTGAAPSPAAVAITTATASSRGAAVKATESSRGHRSNDKK